MSARVTACTYQRLYEATRDRGSGPDECRENVWQPQGNKVYLITVSVIEASMVHRVCSTYCPVGEYRRPDDLYATLVSKRCTLLHASTYPPIPHVIARIDRIDMAPGTSILSCKSSPLSPMPSNDTTSSCSTVGSMLRGETDRYQL
jgi:hypothetical protein